MDWTTDYPTKPGYYWTRNCVWQSSPYAGTDEELCVVLVSPDFSFWHCASELMYDKSDITSAEWYGPIEQPIKARADARIAAAEKLADAAVAERIAGNAKCKVNGLSSQAYILLAHAESNAADAFNAALREYRLAATTTA